jgi:hypothetical protein
MNVSSREEAKRWTQSRLASLQWLVDTAGESGKLSGDGAIMPLSQLERGTDGAINPRRVVRDVGWQSWCHDTLASSILRATFSEPPEAYRTAPATVTCLSIYHPLRSLDCSSRIRPIQPFTYYLSSCSILL